MLFGTRCRSIRGTWIFWGLTIRRCRWYLVPVSVSVRGSIVSRRICVVCGMDTSGLITTARSVRIRVHIHVGVGVAVAVTGFEFGHRCMIIPHPINPPCPIPVSCAKSIRFLAMPIRHSRFFAP